MDHLLPPKPVWYGSTQCVSESKELSTSFHTRPSIGKSTYYQTLFNYLASLLGLSILTLPLAFALTGWTMGIIVALFLGIVACYSAKIIARVCISHPGIRSYTDFISVAFGPRMASFVAIYLVITGFTSLIPFMTLAADSSQALMPLPSVQLYKLIGMMILIPLCFLPLRFLSYGSSLCLVTSIIIFVALLYDAATTVNSATSLYKSSETDWLPPRLGHAGGAVGLWMYTFCGHGVIPTLMQYMAEPERFESILNISFTIQIMLSIIFGMIGYLMFGRNVSGEVSLNLFNNPDGSRILIVVLLSFIIICTIVKMCFDLRQLFVSFDSTLPVPLLFPGPMTDEESLSVDSGGSVDVPLNTLNWLQTRLLSILARILLIMGAGSISILCPNFALWTAFMGSVLGMTEDLLWPIIANVRLSKQFRIRDYTLFTVILILMVYSRLCS